MVRQKTLQNNISVYNTNNYHVISMLKRHPLKQEKHMILHICSHCISYTKKSISNIVKT